MGDRCGELELTDELNSVWAAAMPLSERRRLCARAVSTRRLGGAVHAAADVVQSALVLGEQLRGAAKQLGCPHVGELKRRLRDAGHDELAGRVGRASKKRNKAAHPRPPDVHLVEEVLSAMAAEGGSGSGEVEADFGGELRSGTAALSISGRLRALAEELEQLKVRIRQLEDAAQPEALENFSGQKWKSLFLIWKS